MNKDRHIYGYGPTLFDEEWMNYMSGPSEKNMESYDFLRDYSKVFNHFSANVSQPNPFSNKAMYIIDMLTKMGIKYHIDIFTYEGNKINWGVNDSSSHKLINIIAEPNPESTGDAIVFCAHHDVANTRSENCQDNGASVCNLLRLCSLVKESGVKSKRTIVLFSDSEETGAKGAKHFASQSKAKKDKKDSIINHDKYGKIDSVINLELTGVGTTIWSDCESNKNENDLHESLEKVLGRNISKLSTPPNDAIAFRKYDYTVLCIGTLKEDDMKERKTWKLCHTLEDTIEKCNRENMEDFTNFLLNFTKIKEEKNS